MPHYMIQVGYTPESWASQVKNPRNALERVQPTAEALGGRLESFYYCFGEFDVMAVAEFPNDQAAAAWAVGITAGGACRTFRTTPLLSAQEGVTVMQEANKVSSIYAPPT